MAWRAHSRKAAALVVAALISWPSFAAGPSPPEAWGALPARGPESDPSGSMPPGAESACQAAGPRGARSRTPQVTPHGQGGRDRASVMLAEALLAMRAPLRQEEQGRGENAPPPGRPPEPSREKVRKGKASWLRSRTAVVLMVVAGAVLVGQAVRGTLGDDE